jgi:hypothetical protein
VNKELSNNFYNVPPNIINKINVTLNSVGDSQVVGRERAQNLISTKKVSYGQLKRIIHDLKKIDKVGDNLRYNLYGGELMEKWANTFLNGERKLVKDKKTGTQRINNIAGMNGMRKNAFLKTGEKNKTSKVPTNLLKSNSEKTSVSSLSTVGIFEEIKRIKEMINY